MKKYIILILMVSLFVTLSAASAFAVGVGQNTTSDANASAAASGGQAAAEGGQSFAVNDQTFESGDRPFAYQGQVQYAVLPGYFGENSKPGHQFISLQQLMMYTTEWSVEDAKTMLKDGTRGSVNLNISPLVAKVPVEERSVSVICIGDILDKEKYDVQVLAVGTVNATNKRATSAKDLATAIKTASEYGATHIQFLGQGTNTELSSSGWGIGFNFTKATDSTVSTGGTGFSTGYSGYDNLPWQQFMLLKVGGEPVTSIDGVSEDGKIISSSTNTDAQIEKAIQSATIK